MFLGVTIKLSGPICTCNTQSLGWDIQHKDDGKYNLKVYCKTCHTALLIPHAKFTAWFDLKTPYPGGGDISNVVPFPTKKS